MTRCGAFALAACLTGSAWAQDEAGRKPLWELGLGVAALSLPDYRGSASRSGYVLPLPYVVYRGEWLRADRDGARALLVDTNRFTVDISVSGSAPARTDTDGIRQGMPDLPATVEVGPNASLVLWHGVPGKLELRAPLRSVIALQRSPRSLGAVFSPNLNLDLNRIGGWNVGLATGLTWATQRNHQHYYGVSAAQAIDTPTLKRPAYEARGGYSGWHALAAVSRRFDRMWVGAYARHDSLRGAAIEDSPLVQRRSGFSVGVGVSWVFAESGRLVSVDD